MLKKLIVLGVIGFVAVSVARGTKFGQEVKEAAGDVREWVKEQFRPHPKDGPVSKDEIARLRKEVKSLDKDIMTVVNQLAKERVEVAQLKEKADDLRLRQSKDKELLQSRAAAIKGANEKVTFGDRTLTIAAATSELEDGAKRYATNQKSLEAMDAAVASREKIRDGLDRQLEAMKNQKVELTASVDALEAELTALQLAQMESKYQTDETRLAKIKEDMRAVRTRIEIEREKLKILPAAFDVTPAKTSPTKSVDEIMAPVNGGNKPTGTKTSTPTMPLVD